MLPLPRLPQKRKLQRLQNSRHLLLRELHLPRRLLAPMHAHRFLVLLLPLKSRFRLLARRVVVVQTLKKMTIVVCAVVRVFLLVARLQHLFLPSPLHV